MKLSERIREFSDDYATLLRSGPVLQLLQMADDTAKLEEKIERLSSHIRSVAQWDAYTAQELDALLADTQE